MKKVGFVTILKDILNIKYIQLLLIFLNVTAIAMDKDALKVINLSSLVKCNDEEFLQKIDATPSLIVLADVEGKTILHHAARAANLHVIITLIKRGAKADLPDKEGNTPVHLVIRDSEKPYQVNKCTKALLSLLPKYEYPDAWNSYQLLSVKNNKDQTPVDTALYYRNLPVISIFYRLAYDWFARLSSQKNEEDRSIAQETKDKIEAKFQDDECLRVRIILHSDVVIKYWEEERNELLSKIESLQKEKDESDKNNTSIVTGLLQLL